MRFENAPVEVPPAKPEIKPKKTVPGPEIKPEHPPTLIPEEAPKRENPKPPEVEPVPPEKPKKSVT